MGFLAGISGKAWAGFIAACLVAAALGWAGIAIDSRAVARCEGRHALALAKAVELAKAEARKTALQDAKVAAAGETTREKIRIIYRDREKELEQHVPVDCAKCRLSDSGIGLLNDALSNAARPEAAHPRSEPRTGIRPPGQGGNGDTSGSRGIIDIRQRKVL